MTDPEHIDSFERRCKFKGELHEKTALATIPCFWLGVSSSMASATASFFYEQSDAVAFALCGIKFCDKYGFTVQTYAIMRHRFENRISAKCTKIDIVTILVIEVKTLKSTFYNFFIFPSLRVTNSRLHYM